MFLIGLALSILIGVSLGFFGGGGSILTVPLLVYVFGLEPKPAIASSLLIVGIASISGTIQHARAGHVRPREAALFGVAGMAGAYAGGRASAFLDGGLLLLLFAAMMIITAAAMWNKDAEPHRAAPEPSAGGGLQAPGRLVAQGLAVGAFTGLIGAGGGFLIVPALALWAGLPMPAAIGTSLLIIVLKSATAFAGTLSHVRVDYTLVAAVSVAAIAGSFLGSALSARVAPADLRRAFAAFVMVMGTLILVREAAQVAATITPALPTTWPQVVFALIMLGVGILTGRSSKRAHEAREELALTEGAGI